MRRFRHCGLWCMTWMTGNEWRTPGDMTSLGKWNAPSPTLSQVDSCTREPSERKVWPIRIYMGNVRHYTLLLASFPGLPRFFCSSVSVDNNTRMWKGGEKPPFRIRVLLSTETEEQKKRGRPGNEATLIQGFCFLKVTAADALDDYFNTLDQVQFEFIFGCEILHALPIHFTRRAHKLFQS